MKSPITQADYIPEATRGNYTDMKVLRSGGGWYIGTMYEERDAQGNLTFQEPGSRDSEYFDTEEEADAELRSIVGGTSKTREHP